MSGRGAGGFPLPPLSPGGGAVAAALGAPPPPTGPGMLPGPALRGPGPAGGVGGPGSAAFRPMGPAGPAAQYQVRRTDGRAAPRARGWQGTRRGVLVATSWTEDTGALQCRARRTLWRARLGTLGISRWWWKTWGQEKRVEDLKQLGGSGGFFRTGIQST